MEVDVPTGSSFDAAALKLAHDLVRDGDADGVVSGAVHTSGNVIRKGIKYFRKPGVSLSSFFIMVENNNPEKAYMFADCSVLVDPTPEQLVDIAVESEQSFKLLFGREPRIAMLSFSTKGSADSPSVQKVRTALELVRNKRPGLFIDGEFQADVAVSIDVAKHKKCDGGDVAGRADILIFPSLDAGNICYKLTERLGNYTAIGPILQGLHKPCSDLSRGCSVDDIVTLRPSHRCKSSNSEFKVSYFTQSVSLYYNIKLCNHYTCIARRGGLLESASLSFVKLRDMRAPSARPRGPIAHQKGHKPHLR